MNFSVFTKKTMFIALIVIVLMHNNVYSMEELEEGEPTEKTSLLTQVKSYLRPAKNSKRLMLEEMPYEMRQEILYHLPGNDQGLNYLIRLNSFYPDTTIVEKVETAFLKYLHKHVKDLASEKLGYQMLHFFERTQYKQRLNKLQHVSMDARVLNELILCPGKIPFLRRNDYTANADTLDSTAIEKELKKFYKKTPKKWKELKEGTKEAITLSDFYAIRAGTLTYFEKRATSYNVDENCVLWPLPGPICCLFGCASIGAGIPVGVCVDVDVGVAVGLGGGLGGILGGLVLFVMSGACNELCTDYKESSPDEKKINRIVALMKGYRIKLKSHIIEQSTENENLNTDNLLEIIE